MALDLEYLKKLHTKELLKAWSNARFEGTWHVLGDPNPTQRMIDELKIKNAHLPGDVFGFPRYVETTITKDALKRELDSRPHVPNKPEAKALRKKKIKTSNKRGKRDR